MGNCPCCASANTISSDTTDESGYRRIKTNKNIDKLLTMKDSNYEINLKGLLNEKYSSLEEFCNKEFSELENLNLSCNDISDISALKNLKSPNLRILDLSDNNIKNLDIFRELQFNLEALYIKGNQIEDLSIFKEDTILNNLQKLSFTFYENDKNKEILAIIRKNINDIDIQRANEANDEIIKRQMDNKSSTLKLSLN